MLFAKFKGILEIDKVISIIKIQTHQIVLEFNKNIS